MARLGGSFTAAALPGDVPWTSYANAVALRADARGATVDYTDPPRDADNENAVTAPVRETRLSLGGRSLTRTSRGALRYEPFELGLVLAADLHGDLTAVFDDASGSLRFAASPRGGRGFTSARATRRSELFSSGPVLALAPSGAALGVWAPLSGRGLHLLAQDAATGGFARPIAVKAPGGGFYSVAAAIDSRDEAVIVGSTYAAAYTDSLDALLRTPSGELDALVPITSDAAPNGAADQEVVIDDHGRGVVAWIGSHDAVVTRRFSLG